MKNQTTNVIDSFFIREVRKEIQPLYFEIQKSVLRTLRDKDLCHEEDSPLCRSFKKEIFEILAKYQELYYQQPDGVTCLCADPEFYSVINCATEIEQKIDEWNNEGEGPSYPWIEEDTERRENEKYWSEHKKKCLTSADFSSFFGEEDEDSSSYQEDDDLPF